MTTIPRSVDQSAGGERTQLDPSDPRATLSPNFPPARVANTVAFGKIQSFSMTEPAHERIADSAQSWTVRGQNFYVSYTQASGPVTLAAVDCPDEYMMIVLGAPTDVLISVEGHRDRSIAEPSVVVVPPGRSTVSTAGACLLIRVFSVRCGKFLRAANEGFYTNADPRAAPFQPWAPSPHGYQIRAYPLSAAEPEPGVFGRIYRSSTLMVNLLEPQRGPRDPGRLSPHSHDDFEQCTITVAGDYIHHFRTPWTPNASNWRPDQHVQSPSPSITIIPSGVIHTSQAVGDETHVLIDVFGPPRKDFDAAGWVRNADDYPPQVSR